MYLLEIVGIHYLHVKLLSPCSLTESEPEDQNPNDEQIQMLENENQDDPAVGNWSRNIRPSAEIWSKTPELYEEERTGSRYSTDDV